MTRKYRGWSCTSRPGDKLSARWVHDASGWMVFHCGHPTANWPYAAESPGIPGCIVASHTGRGWRTLDIAFSEIELLIAGKLALFEDGPCKHGHRFVIADPNDPPQWIVDELARRGVRGAFNLEVAK